MRSYWFSMNYMNLLKYTVHFSVYNIPVFCVKYMTGLIWNGLEGCQNSNHICRHVKGKMSLQSSACLHKTICTCLYENSSLPLHSKVLLTEVFFPSLLCDCMTQHFCQGLLLLVLFQGWISPAQFISVSAFPLDQNSPTTVEHWDLWAKSTMWVLGD